jgi:hypothetical protein
VPIGDVSFEAVPIEGRIAVVNIEAPHDEVGAGYVYDPPQDTWEPLPPWDGPLETFGAQGLPQVMDGQLLVHGSTLGEPETEEPTERLASWTPGSASWRSLSVPPIRRRHTNPVVLDGRLYVIGGLLASGYMGDECLPVTHDGAVYDPSTDRWERLPDLPSGLAALLMSTDGRRIFAMGFPIVCPEREPGEVLAYAYDPREATWSALGDVPQDLAGLHQRLVWTGAEALAWPAPLSADSGLRWAPATGDVQAMASSPRDDWRGAAVVWAGDRLFTFGGAPEGEPTPVGDGLMWLPDRP